MLNIILGKISSKKITAYILKIFANKFKKGLKTFIIKFLATMITQKVIKSKFAI